MRYTAAIKTLCGGLVAQDGDVHFPTDAEAFDIARCAAKGVTDDPTYWLRSYVDSDGYTVVTLYKVREYQPLVRILLAPRLMELLGTAEGERISSLDQCSFFAVASRPAAEV